MIDPDYSNEVRKAVSYYWFSKKTALGKNQSGSNIDRGKRGAATAGKNFLGFAQMFAQIAENRGSNTIDIHQNKKSVVLPGHFRPSKQWDLVIMHQGRLLAALEFKSLGGPSFGNNANNRCEEALGSGIDLAVAQREGLIGPGANPFVGYIILVEDEVESRRLPKRGSSSVHFETDPVFKSASFQDRMRILCERMVQERIYTAAAAISSPSDDAESGTYFNLSTTTSVNRLIAKFGAHIEIETRN